MWTVGTEASFRDFQGITVARQLGMGQTNRHAHISSGMEVVPTNSWNCCYEALVPGRRRTAYCHQQLEEDCAAQFTLILT